MTVIKVRKSVFWSVVIFLVLPLVLSTCDAPMGMGPPIDFEPPVLTMDPTPNPMYVRNDATISGSVTDNIAVDRVILRDSETGKQLFTAKLLPNNRWEITLVFSPEQNGETILADIVAYDTAGNSDAHSIVSITLIIDIGPPVVEDIYIQRTPTRTAYLESYNTLKMLEDETADKLGEKNAYVNMYQNGAFYINAKISESETRIESVKLSFFDSRYPNTEILSLDPLADSSLYMPRWLISEELLINAGNLLWGNYKANYLNGDRYYYRARVTATDLSENEGGFRVIEDQEYFCLWKTADDPKGVLDTLVVLVTEGNNTVMTKGATLPVIFFDDDRLDWGYTALFTKEQWDGTEPIAPEFFLDVAGDTAKFEKLMGRLSNPSLPVYNWRYDRNSDDARATSEPVINQIPPDGADEKYYYIVTGNEGSDYGDFILVTMVKDKKQPPHDRVYGNEDLSITKYRKYNVSLVDENAPLIVFDKINGSPEENTFPQLTNGETFTIHGYTLRENSSGFNQVEKFRLAWIPYGIAGGPDANITKVKEALENNSGYPPGVQWWDLSEAVSHENNIGEDTIGTTNYAKQPFSKTFNILGNPVDGEDKHFFYNDSLENEIKTFIFYAEDNMGHVIHSQLNLLDNKTPPNLKVYDITGRSGDLEKKLLEPQGVATEPIVPDINKFITSHNPSGGIINDAVRAAYQAVLNARQEEIYRNIVPYIPGFGLTDQDKASSLQAYPRNTLLSYWVEAEESGGLKIVSITMKDNTYSTSTEGTGFFDEDGTRKLSYAEKLPEVTQRTFLFEATNTLGVTARIQRTVTITNAAVLSEITTVKQSGTYPVDETIVLEARFSSQVRWTGTNPPLLNVRYNKSGGPQQLVQIPTSTPKDTPSLFLAFPVKVVENDGGTIETLWKGIGGIGDSSTNETDRPITLPSGTFVLDDERKDSAFLPGYSSGVEWTDSKGSLQATKKIDLDGVYPRMVGNLVVGGKTAYSTAPTNNIYYFKTDETMSFTITATKRIETGGNGNPRIQFTVAGTNYYASWERSTTNINVTPNTYSMIFSVPVTAAAIANNGLVSNIRLNTDLGTIVDGVGNPLRAANGSPILATSNLPTIDSVTIDKVLPGAPGIAVNSVNFPTSTSTEENWYYVNPRLAINTPTTPAPGPSGLEKFEYSLNDGLGWQPWTSGGAHNGLTTHTGTGGYMTINSSVQYNNSSHWILKTRYVNRAGAAGAETRHFINVNTTFPKLVSVSAQQANNTYRANSRLDFNLAFSDDVHTQNGTVATITLSNRTNNYSTATPVPAYQITLNVTAVALTAAKSTLVFSWLPANFTGKEMLEGLYISRISFTGLRDRYGNQATTGSASTAGHDLTIASSPDYDVPNIPEGIIVDCIAPTLSAMTPATAQGTTTGATGTRAASVMATAGADYNRVITLQFSEAVQAGTGTITIKPHGQYLIPPVFENDTYYLNVSSEARSTTPVSGYTKITGFYDIYNSNLLTTAQRASLTAGTNMTNAITPDTRTGQSEGPYIRMTQGLKTGPGYTGNYHNNMEAVATYPEFYKATVDNTANTPVGPNPIGSYMVPDTSTKWVLDYRFSINNNANTQIVPATANNPALANASTTAVPNIRTALSTAKFRWQELDVVATTQFSDNGTTYPVGKNSGRYVKITLNEPLEKGLEWDICYPAGTFTDVAGNQATAINYTGNNPVDQDTASTHWFVSAGVQTPVIRVNRKSYDARTGDWQGTSRTYANPTNRGGTGGSSAGWGINDFNFVHFRVETETPNASLSYGKIDGRTVLGPSNIPIGSAYVTTEAVGSTWNIAVPNGGTAGTNTTAYDWTVYANANAAYTRGTWVRPNLIRRAAGAAAYWAVVENGIVSRRDLQYTNSNHNGFRSYNKDATIGDLNSLNLGTTVASSVSSGGEGNTDQNRFTYYPTEARKDYVAATATVVYGPTNTVTSSRGYEGVFRSVIALFMANATNPLCVEGSNVKNGMPSVPGFPVRDAEETGDNRYIKVFYNDGTENFNDGQSTANRTRFLWVSTEIVTQWYFLKWGNGGTHQSSGEVNNYLTAGYGDLTYGYRVGSYGN